MLLSLFVIVLFVSDNFECRPSDKTARIVQYDLSDDPSKIYNYKFSTSNKIIQQESAYNDEEKEKVVEGSYSFIAPNLEEYRVAYTADKNGFHPKLMRISEVSTSTEKPGVEIDVKPTEKPFGGEPPFVGIGTTCLATLCGGK